jgi:hypothetical protein
MVALACNSRETEAGGLEFKANLSYTASSRPSWATEQKEL